MIKIGDFSKLGRVSVKTLRYYDEVGLLKPVHVERPSGYRYYAAAQLARLYRILALRELGFSLEEIHRFLDEELPVEQMRGMLKLRQTQIRQQMDAESQRLAQVERWLSQLEQEDAVTQYDVVIKRMEETQIASVRGLVPSPPEQRGMWETLKQQVFGQKVRVTGTPMAIYHDAEFKESDWDIEVCMPISGGMQPQPPVKLRTLEGVETMACVVHNGPFSTIMQAYDALAKWVDENSYRIIGPGRELNIRPPQPIENQDDPNTVNEIQFPVEKV